MERQNKKYPEVFFGEILASLFKNQKRKTVDS